MGLLEVIFLGLVTSRALMARFQFIIIINFWYLSFGLKLLVNKNSIAIVGIIIIVEEEEL